MLRSFALCLLGLVCACAARERPPAPVAAVLPAPQFEPAGQPDPRIYPLSREEEELAR